MSNAKVRDSYIDIVKAFTAICVVVGHCIQYGSGNKFFSNNSYFDNIVFKIIYSFHMPLFMLVSGYLFAFSINKRKWSHNIVYKFKTLVIPILLWSVIPFVLSIVGMYESDESISFRNLVKKYISTSLENLWFLWAVFWCSIIVIIVHRFFKDNIIAYTFGLLLTFLTPDNIGLLSNLALYKFMYPYFLIGYFYNLKNKKEIYRPIYQKNITLIIIGIAYVGLMFFYNYNSYIYTSGYCIFKGDIYNQIYNDVYRFVIGLVGSAFIMLLIHKCHKYLRGKVKQIFLFIGRNPLGIYIISGIIFSYVFNIVSFNITSLNYGIAIVESLTVLAISLLCTGIIQKSKILNKLLLGGR